MVAADETCGRAGRWIVTSDQPMEQTSQDANVDHEGKLPAMSPHQTRSHSYCHDNEPTSFDVIMSRAVEEIEANLALAGEAAINFLAAHGCLIPVVDPATAICGSTLRINNIISVEIESAPLDLPHPHVEAAVVADGPDFELIVGNGPSADEAVDTLFAGVAQWLQERVGAEALARIMLLGLVAGPTIYSDPRMPDVDDHMFVPPHVADVYRRWELALQDRYPHSG